MLMGLLVDGIWRDDSFDTTRMRDGRFNRPTTKFRNWVTADGSPGHSGEAGFKAAAGRLSPLRLARLPGRTAPRSSAS
jgi:putative glutathione S-transferase